MKWAIVGILVGLAAAASTVFLFPERETAITRDVFHEEIRRTMAEVGPLVNDFKK